jgi:hypothetical protein
MNRKVWILVVFNTIFSLGHHVDHAVRHHIGWPLSHEVTPFTHALGIYVFILVGTILTRRGVVGPGYWSILAMIGIVFIVGTHFGPLAEDPVSAVMSEHATRTRGLIAVTWLVLFVTSLVTAAAYSGWRWAKLRHPPVAAGGAMTAG